MKHDVDLMTLTAQTTPLMEILHYYNGQKPKVQPFSFTFCNLGL